MKLKKSFLIVGAIALIGLLITGWALVGSRWNAQTSKPEKNHKTSSGNEQNLLMGMEIKIPGSEPDSYWALKVERFTEQKKIGIMTKIKGDYRIKDKLVYHVDAQTGEINWQSRQLRLKEKVEFTSVDGKKLMAQEFLWDPVQKRITAERGVEISAPGYRILTEKVTANLGMKKVTFIGATRMIHQK